MGVGDTVRRVRNQLQTEMWVFIKKKTQLPRWWCLRLPFHFWQSSIKGPIRMHGGAHLAAHNGNTYLTTLTLQRFDVY